MSRLPGLNRRTLKNNDRKEAKLVKIFKKMFDLELLVTIFLITNVLVTQFSVTTK